MFHFIKTMESQPPPERPNRVNTKTNVHKPASEMKSATARSGKFY
jgi:hypothetical protein